MAEKRRVGVHPGEAYIQVHEGSHARHDIWSEIQKVEAVGVHNVVEEIGEGGNQTRPQGIGKTWDLGCCPCSWRSGTRARQLSSRTH